MNFEQNYSFVGESPVRLEDADYVQDDDEDMPRYAELGCGQDKPDGFLGVDKIDTEETDVQFDLDSEEWSLPENYFRYVRCKDLFEHLENPVQFVENLYRVVVPGGVVEVRSPHRSSQNWTDPTHKRLIGLDTFDYYFTVDGKYSYYSSAEFEVVERYLTFSKRKMLPYNYILEPLVNFNGFTHRFFEASFLSNVFPAENLVVKLRKPVESDFS